MGTVNYMHSSEPTHQLLALAVFADSFNSAYVRSIHVHEENIGSHYKVQQEFLLNPGEYVRLGEAVFSRSFQPFASDAGTKQTMDTIIKMHLNEGWHCVLDYRNNLPSETKMPYLLTPSRNVDLNRVPSLEHDLKLVESALMSSMRNSHNMLSNHGTFSNHRPYGEGKSTDRDNCARISSALTLSFPSNLTQLDHLNNRLPGLETPERTPQGQQSDSWQNWGSELELASPEIPHTNRSSQSQQAMLRSSSPVSSQTAGCVGSFWNPSTLLDLNLDLTGNPPQDKDIDCTLGLSSPISKPKSFLNLQLGIPSLSLQQSAVTEDSMDCITLESYGDSPSSYKDIVVDLNINKPTKAIATQGEKPMCSEDSTDCQGCVINMSPWDMNGNPSGTSTEMLSASFKDATGYVNFGAMINNSSAPMKIHQSSAPISIHPVHAGINNIWYLKLSKASLATSGDMCPVPNIEAVFNDSPTTSIVSSDTYTAAYKKDPDWQNGFEGFPTTSSEHSWKGQTKESSGRASCSSISTQSVQQGPCKAYTNKNKRRISGLRPTSERLHEITVQEITKYFSVPITQAAKELKVGLTVLKKRCRHLGIPRWPHRKMKSIDSLINNVQDLADDQGVVRSPRVQNTVRELEEQKKLMEEMPGVELAERTKKLRQACFKANYKRRKLSVAVSNIPCNPVIQFPPSIPHSFNMLPPSTLVIQPPLNHHTMDHFL